MAARLVDPRGQHPAPARIQRGETEFLQFQPDPVQAEPRGNRRVNLQGLARDPAAFRGPKRGQRAHIVQAVGELQQDHADIIAHGHEHLAEIMRLGLFQAFKLHLVELADAVHERGHALAEPALQGLLGGRRVFDHIMQHGGHEGLVIHVHLAQDARHGQGMMDIGLAARAFLPRVRPGAELIGAPHLLDLMRLQIGADTLA